MKTAAMLLLLLLLLLALGVSVATADCNTLQNVLHDYSNVTITWTYNDTNRVCSAHNAESGATEASTDIAEGETKSIGGIGNDCLKFVCLNSHLYLDVHNSSCATETGCSRNFTKWDAECGEDRSCFCRAGSSYRYPPPPSANGGTEVHLLVLLDNICVPQNTTAANYGPPNSPYPFGFSPYDYGPPYSPYPLGFLPYDHMDLYHQDYYRAYSYWPFPFHNHHLLAYPFHFVFHAAQPYWLPVSHFHWGMQGPYWHPGNGGWVPWLPSPGGGFPWGMGQGGSNGPESTPTPDTTDPLGLDPKDCEEGKSFSGYRKGTCITYHCVPDNATTSPALYHFEIQRGGCFVNGTCVREGHTETSECKKYRCEKDDTTGEFRYKVGYEGCLYNNTCYDNGTVVQDVDICESIKCSLDPETGDYALVNVRNEHCSKDNCARAGMYYEPCSKWWACELRHFKTEACQKEHCVPAGMTFGCYNDKGSCKSQRHVVDTDNCIQIICYTDEDVPVGPAFEQSTEFTNTIHHAVWTARTIGCLGPMGCMAFGDEYVDKETGDAYRCDNASGILGKRSPTFYKGCRAPDGSPIVQGHSVLYDDQFYACTPEGVKQVPQNYTVLPKKKNWKLHCQDTENGKQRQLGELWNWPYGILPEIVCTCHPTKGTAVCSANASDVLYLSDED